MYTPPAVSARRLRRTPMPGLTCLTETIGGLDSGGENTTNFRIFRWSCRKSVRRFLSRLGETCAPPSKTGVSRLTVVFRLAPRSSWVWNPSRLSRSKNLPGRPRETGISRFGLGRSGGGGSVEASRCPRPSTVTRTRVTAFWIRDHIGHATGSYPGGRSCLKTQRKISFTRRAPI